MYPSAAEYVHKQFVYEIAGADKVSIDTNVDGPYAGLFPTTFDLLECWIICRTDEAGPVGASVDVTVNNDTGSNYDHTNIRANNTSPASGFVNTSAWGLMTASDTSSSSYSANMRLTVPGYGGTAFFKSFECFQHRPSATAANDYIGLGALVWLSTNAITRLKISAQGAAKLKVGSKMVVYLR
jgi:hypothetical protein